MPILTSSFLPPTPSPSSTNSSDSSSLLTSRSGSAASSLSVVTSPERGTRPDAKDVAQTTEDCVSSRTYAKEEHVLNIPAMMLKIPSISDDMAASLAVSLLGHVLFLKSQVPFPVTQLARLPPSSNARAARKRADLVNVFDELSSHLHTTFTALSTALAKNKARSPSLQSGVAPEVTPTTSAHLVFVVGPTVGAPKARIVLSLDGLEVKMWGARVDVVEPLADGGEVEEIEEGSDEEEEESQEDDSEEGDTEEHESDAGVYNSQSGLGSQVPSPPPSDASLSRSPSPASSSPPSPPQRRSLSPKTLPADRATQPRLTSPPQTSRAEEQQALRAAERLLSRTLANAYAEGGGMAAELAPTHTHILLHAPRRFVHPAWNPRQNATSSLDGMLADFLVESGLRPGKVRARKTGVKTEGVYVGCGAGRHAGDVREEEDEEEEEDEMIWWTWDGKLTGFAEW